MNNENNFLFKGFQGALDLLLNKNKVAEDIKYGKPIMYKVQFPYWNGHPPRVTKITVNGQTICTGSKISCRYLLYFFFNTLN